MATKNEEDLRKILFQHLDEDEMREIRRVQRDAMIKNDFRKLDNWLEGAKVFAIQTGEIRKNSMNASIEYGKIFVRFAFLLNGGAMIALMAFAGTLFGRADIASVAISFSAKLPFAFAIYSAGLIFASLSAGAGYANFQFVYGSQLGEGHLLRLIQAGNAFQDLDLKNEKDKFDIIDKWLERTLWLGVGFGILSLIMFIAATIIVARGFWVIGL